MFNKYKVVSKPRFIISITLLILLSVFIVTGLFKVNASWALVDIQYIEETISKDDTLWDIAAEYTFDGEDVRKMIYIIKTANDLDCDVIYEGQVLRIPVKASNITVAITS